jgi:membrane-associated phospholipid phosphatase
VLKWIVGRHRPFTPGEGVFQLHPLHGGIVGFFTANNQSFPSGHAALAMSTAGALAIAVPRARWAWLGLALVVMVERVLENAHYCSDVCAGAAAGSLCAVAALALLARVDPTVGGLPRDKNPPV